MDKAEETGSDRPFNEVKFVTRDSILALFEQVDAALSGQPPIEVFVVGYSAIVLARKNNRGSDDVDIIPSRFSRVFAQHGWFTKLAAFRNKDKVDMVQMIQGGVVDPTVLDAMFADWNRDWFDGSPELAANYAEVRHDGTANRHS